MYPFTQENLANERGKKKTSGIEIESSIDPRVSSQEQ